MAEPSEVEAKKRAKGRFVVTVEQGSPHGDLFELEQTTIYRVIDSQTSAHDVPWRVGGEPEQNEWDVGGRPLYRRLRGAHRPR